MIIKYEFATESISIDVPEDWAIQIQDFDRKDHNNNQTERRRHTSLDGMDYEGEVFADPINITGKTDVSLELTKAICTLQPQQRELLLQVYFYGYSITEIARSEDVSEGAIRARLVKIYYRMKKQLGAGATIWPFS